MIPSHRARRCFRTLQRAIRLGLISGRASRNLLVLFAVVGQDEILELHLHLDPLLVGERGPDVVGLGDGRLVGLQDHFGAVVVDVERSQDQDESREGLETEQTARPTIYTAE